MSTMPTRRQRGDTPAADPAVVETLPHDLDAERSVLGAILVHNPALFEISSVLKPEMFFRDAHRTIFASMLSLAAAGRPIEPLTVKDDLGAAACQSVGGAGYLAGLLDGVPRSTNVTAYARIVVQRWRLRRVIVEADRAQKAAYAAHAARADVDELVRSTQEAFWRLSGAGEADTLFSAGDLTRELCVDLERIRERRGQVTGLSTGLVDLDWMTSGLQPEDLVVIGGRPSSGKTVLGLQLALTVATHAPVLFCSLEMARGPVWRRALFNRAQLDSFGYLRGRLDAPADHRRVSDALEALNALSLTVDERPGASPMHVLAAARRVQLRHGLSLVIVDYLQLMQPSDPATLRHQNRTQIVGEQARALKEIARSLRVPVVVLSQLRRETSRSDRPTMGDLRESGDIEAHADVILLLHRDAKVEAAHEDGPVPVELILEKQRNGPTGPIKLLNFREQYRFVSSRSQGDAT